MRDGDQAQRDTALDTLLETVAQVLIGQTSLGGLVDYLHIETPDFLSICGGSSLSPYKHPLTEQKNLFYFNKKLSQFIWIPVIQYASKFYGDQKMQNEQPVPEIPDIKTVLKDELYKLSVKDMGCGYRAYSIKKPGAKLSQAAQSAIYEAYIPLTTYAFGADMTAYWQSRIEEGYMANAEELVLVTDINHQLAGWTSYSLIYSDKAIIVYNDSSGITPPHQKNKLMGGLFRQRIADCVQRFSGANIPLLFATRTETPIMYSMQKKLTRTLYPSPDYPTPEFISNQAVVMAEWLGQKDKLDKKSLIIRNAYSMLDELYGELPTSGDAALDNWIKSQVGSLDAFLLMGEAN